MYNQTRKIPTILALMILLIGLAGGIYLVENRTKSSTKANLSGNPLSIRVTNLSDNLFSVSWLTEIPASGQVIFGETESDTSQIAFDDRDEDNRAKPYFTHHVTIRNLNPETTYYFHILSAGKKYFDNDKNYSITTAAKETVSNELEPAYGQILDPENQPAEGALVILNLPQALPLSTISKPSGNWLIPLNMVRGNDLKILKTGDTPSTETIFIYTGTESQAQATTDTNNDSPVPPITIGKTYNFEGLQGKNKSVPKTDTLAQNNLLDQESNILGGQTESDFEVFTPQEGATFTSNRPLFRGKALPDTEVNIELTRPQKISGKTTSGKDGLWSWTPPRDLAADKHSVTISSIDKENNPLEITRTFLVFKSGTQVLGEATPSGTTTITPTPTITGYIGGTTPSATLKPVFSPTPTATVTSKPPVSGNIINTFFLLGSGIVLVILGFAKLIGFGVKLE